MTIKILIADDHAIIRDGLKLILETNREFKVVAEANNGLEAINKAKDYEPDVVIMDIAMPGMNGIEATKRIKDENNAIKIVILSIHSTSEDIYRALKNGASGYLLKESAGSEVVEAVIAVFNGRRYLSRKVDDTLIDSCIYSNKDTSPQSPLESLSDREREVLQLVAEGNSNSQIAGLLFLSVKTVETYRSRMMEKLGIHDLTSLIKFALQQGIIN